MASVYGEELDMYRDVLRSFYRKEVEPNLHTYEQNGTVGREIWRKAGEAGLLGVCIPEEYGGPGDEGLAIVAGAHELGYSVARGTVGAFLGTDICTLFLVNQGTEEQKQKWFPSILSGETIQCMGMTEPDSGSDAFSARTTAIRQGDEYVLNGTKHFISNGAKANLIYVIARTDPEQSGGRGLSMIMVPSDTPGVTQRRMKTMGYVAGDVGEIHLNDVRVPITNMVGEEGKAFSYFHNIMALDRLQISANAMGAVQYALETTAEYVKNREIFRRRVVDFQNTQFKLAEVEIDIEVSQAYFDSLVMKYKNGQFENDDGSRSKIWFSDMECRVIDTLLQFWGGMGWMDETPISRFYTAARLQKIHVGPNEMHKHILGKKYL
jgi:acyl-CoA dehydrogenase